MPSQLFIVGGNNIFRGTGPRPNYNLMHLSMLSRSGGRPGIGGGFDVISLPVVGTFDHSSSPGGRDF